MAVWQIRAGHDASLAEKFISEERVCLGFGVKVSLTEFATLSALKEYMSINAPHEGPRAANSMWKLLHEVQIGDLVLMPSKPRKQEYAIGRIKGDYELAPELVASGRDPHSRPVLWLKTGIPGERLAHLSLPPRGTITRLRSYDIETRTEAILD